MGQTTRTIPVGALKQNSPGQSRGRFASNRSLPLAVLAAALSGLVLAALSGLLALLPRLVLAAATLLLTTVLAALSGLLALLPGLLLAAALATLVGIIHDHSCVRINPPAPRQRMVARNVPFCQVIVMICLSAVAQGASVAAPSFCLPAAHFSGRGTRKSEWQKNSAVEGAGQHTQYPSTPTQQGGGAKT